MYAHACVDCMCGVMVRAAPVLGCLLPLCMCAVYCGVLVCVDVRCVLPCGVCKPASLACVLLAGAEGQRQLMFACKA